MHEVWNEIGNLDKTIQSEEPFKLVKTDKEKCTQLIVSLVRNLHDIGVLLKPFLPATSEKILKAVKENKVPETPLFLRK